LPKIFDYKKFYDIGKGKKASNWLTSKIEERINHNMNFLCVISGDTGSGKSYTALRIGELLGRVFDVPFTVDHVLFNPMDFFRLVQILPSKSTIIFDEGSVTMDAQRWQTVESKLLGWITETFRFKQFIVFIVAPDLSMINSRVRKCTHAFIRMYGRNGEEARVYKLQSSHLGTQYLCGVGVLRNIVLPNYEQCKRPSCRDCKKYKTCNLLRGQYERKKEEAFNELLTYTQFRLGQLTLDKVLAGSPYGFAKKTVRDEWGENIVDEDVDEE